MLEPETTPLLDIQTLLARSPAILEYRAREAATSPAAKQSPDPACEASCLRQDFRKRCGTARLKFNMNRRPTDGTAMLAAEQLRLDLGAGRGSAPDLVESRQCDNQRLRVDAIRAVLELMLDADFAPATSFASHLGLEAGAIAVGGSPNMRG